MIHFPSSTRCHRQIILYSYFEPRQESDNIKITITNINLITLKNKFMFNSHFFYQPGVVGTTRFCSSRDMGNQCQYIRYPDHDRVYRACIYTCKGNGCNGASGVTLSAIVMTLCGFMAMGVRHLVRWFQYHVHCGLYMYGRNSRCVPYSDLRYVNNNAGRVIDTRQNLPR